MRAVLDMNVLLNNFKLQNRNQFLICKRADGGVTGSARLGLTLGKIASAVIVVASQ